MQGSLSARSESLIEALPYIQKFRGQTFVIKYGGAAMEEEHIVDRFLKDVVFLEAVGINPVLVHGGGKAITAKMRDAGLKAQFVNGLRVTDAQSITIVEETLDGEINPNIVTTLNEFGGKARGFSGNLYSSLKTRSPIRRGRAAHGYRFRRRGRKDQHGRSSYCHRRGSRPRHQPDRSDENGVVLNINADIAAAALASELKASKLIYVSDVPGIMRDPAIKDSLIPTVSLSQIDSLIKQKVLGGGMLPKIQSAASALQNGVQKIHMIGGHIQHCLLLEIFTNAGIGTEITL